jgi:hypothetical protein
MLSTEMLVNAPLPAKITVPLDTPVVGGLVERETDQRSFTFSLAPAEHEELLRNKIERELMHLYGRKRFIEAAFNGGFDKETALHNTIIEQSN